MKTNNKLQISDLPIIIALTLLTCSALLLIQNQEKVADEMAEYAYYLIVIGIACKFFIYLLNNNKRNLKLS
jgi:hypothetical protein